MGRSVCAKAPVAEMVQELHAPRKYKGVEIYEHATLRTSYKAGARVSLVETSNRSILRSTVPAQLQLSAEFAYADRTDLVSTMDPTIRTDIGGGTIQGVAGAGLVRIQHLSIQNQIAERKEEAAYWLSGLQRTLCLLNRHEQVAEFVSTFRTAASKTARRFVVVVQGEPEELAGDLVTRIIEHEIAPSGTPYVNLDILRWPTPQLDSLLTYLAEKLPTALAPEARYSRRIPAQKAFERAMKTSKKSIFFSHVIDGQRAKRDGGRLLSEWLDYFARSCPCPSSPSVLGAFLCVETCRERTPECEWLLDTLCASKGKYGDALWMLSPLQPIRRLHVQEWAGEVRRQNIVPDWASVLNGIHLRAFPNNVLQMPYYEACQVILSALKDAAGTLALPAAPSFRRI